MLAAEKKELLKANGLYQCKPDIKYRGKLYERDLYHCCNWVFRVVENKDGEIFMVDTYWSGGGGVHIHVTDENFEEFTLLLDLEKVRKIKGEEKNHYEDYYYVAMDSGGWRSATYFVEIEAQKSKRLLLEEVDNEIRHLESSIRYWKEKRKMIEKGA